MTWRSRSTSATPTPAAVLLLHADVVVMDAARFGFGSVHVPLYSASPGSTVSTTLLSLSTSTFATRRRADHVDVQLRGPVRLELVAHDVVAAAHVEDDVVRGGVAVALAEGVEDAGAVVLLGQGDAVGNVRGPVVARRLEAEAVALVQGVVDEALRIPAGDVGRLLVALGIVAGTAALPASRRTCGRPGRSRRSAPRPGRCRASRCPCRWRWCGWRRCRPTPSSIGKASWCRRRGRRRPRLSWSGSARRGRVRTPRWANMQLRWPCG